MGHIRMWSAVRPIVAFSPPRFPIAVVVAAAVAWLAIVGHCAPMPSGFQQSHPAQPVSTSLPAALSASADQPHFAQGLPICKSSKVFAIAELPKSATTALLVLGTVLVGLAGKGWLAQQVMLAGRSPPHAPAHTLIGQEILTRFCLARR